MLGLGVREFRLWLGRKGVGGEKEEEVGRLEKVLDPWVGEGGEGGGEDEEGAASFIRRYVKPYSSTHPPTHPPTHLSISFFI